ncbi:MAG: rane protein [Myxococcaceae bacterium]|nr:rane protein [Myxococcaceae bacterium]
MTRPLSLITALAFLLGVALTVYFFRRFSPGKAALMGILMGMLFLPEQTNFKLPLLPEIHKYRLENLALLGCVLTRAYLPKVERWWYVVVGLTFVSAVATYLTNTETITSEAVTMTGLNFKDGMYIALAELTMGLCAAYVAMRCFHAERDIVHWTRMLTGAGLIYAVFILIEVRMSPQTHNWIYGHPASDAFDQSYRWGGYRPVVFMAHGLATSLFELSAAVTATVLARFHMPIWKLSGWWAMVIMCAVVLMCRSTGVWMYMAFAIPMVRWASPKAMHRLAMVLAVLVCLYPWLRATGVFPVEWLLAQFAKLSEERMLSLKFRFDNEDLLIAHAMVKPWFGWSTSYGRNMLFDEYGHLATITDGGWIIALGNGGLLGLSVYLSVPVVSIFLTAKRAKRIRDPRYRVMVGALNLYLAIMWLDILPNGTFTLLPFFLGGALCSMSRTLGALKAAPSGASERPRPERVVSTRPRAGTAIRPASSAS